jgi:hypothetical protein
MTSAFRFATILSLGVVLGGLPLLADPLWTLAAVPDVHIEGPAGSTIGWGYEITDLATDQWLVMTDIDPLVLQHATPDFVFDFTIVAPLATVRADYVPAISGLFGLTWDGDAPDWFVNSGSIVLSAEWYAGDPLAGATDLGPAAPASIDVTAQVSPGSQVPEPGTRLLLAAVLSAGAALKRTLRSGSR